MNDPDRIFSVLRISLLYGQLYTREEGRICLISVSLTQLQQKSLCSRFRRQDEQQYRSPLSALRSLSLREGSVALSMDHPRGTHSRYVTGCCLIPLGICDLKNNSRRITYGIGGVWGMPSLSPLSSLDVSKCTMVPVTFKGNWQGNCKRINKQMNN